ncbi:MAG: BadF/BadG/BcrA/BcrD ATPase family protein [Pseudomonadota bacterium]
METAHLGIDGGGSGCRGRLVLPDGAAFEAQGGPANAFSDLSGAATALGELAKELTKAANWSGPLHCVAGVAGCRLPAQGQALADALPLAAKVVDDAVIAARGALGAGDGTVIGLGTGAFFCRQNAGEFTQVSGWGLNLGDEGSGAWLGREAVRAALAAFDGRGAADALTDAILDNAEHPLRRFGRATPAEFAALAPLVIDHAETATGAALITAIGEEITRALSALGTTADETLVLTGGLGTGLKRFLPDPLAARCSEPLADALDGALSLARALP